MNKEILMSLLEEKKFKSIHDVLSKYNAVDIANLLSELDEKDLAPVFRIIEKDKAAEVFSYMENDLQENLINSFSDQEIINIMEDMYTDDMVDFLEDMPANVVKRLLKTIDSETRAEINKILKYGEDSVGSIMTTEFVDLSIDMTVKEALNTIKRVGIDSETIYTCYVVEKRKLKGIVSAKKLLTSDYDVLVKDIMNEHFIAATTTDDREVAANLFRKYGFISIPVIDKEGYIVGIVTFDDAIDVLTEETTEDMQKMAAMVANDESYLKTSVFTHAKHRIIWLLILMLSASVTGAIISRYENAFAAVPLLVSFIPMLMDTGGNCGSQSSTLIIRGLAVDELHFGDFWKIVWKEFRVSLLVSSVLALANTLRIFFVYKNLTLAIVVGISIVFTVIVAKLVGCTLPILAKKLKMDPAIMAAPLITTIVDTCSIIIYFKVATILFNL